MVGEVLEVMKELAPDRAYHDHRDPRDGFRQRRVNENDLHDKGYIAEDAPPDVLFTAPKNPRTREFLSRYLAG